MSIESVLAEVAAERREIDPAVRIDWPAERWLAVLGERVGAVCQDAVRGGHDADLRAALIEVVAACGAWYEAVRYDGAFGERVAKSAHHAYLSGLVSIFVRLAGPGVNGLSLVDCAAVAVAWAASLDRTEEGGRRG